MHPSSSPLSFFVDISAAADDALSVRWAEKPGHHERVIPSPERARIDALAEAVYAAESIDPCGLDAAKRPGAIERTRLALGRALYDLLDGPERALAQRLQAADAHGRTPALAVRLRCPEARDARSLAQHPAVHWRWELLADRQGPLAVRNAGLSLSVQLGERVPAAPRAFEHRGLRILFMAYSPNGIEPVLDYEREEEIVLDAVSEFVRDGRARLRVVEEGSLDELERCLLGQTYDIVHLTGHGVLTPSGPRLLMEDAVGDCHWVSPDDLLRTLRRAGRMPEVVMISSCHSAGSRDGVPSLAAQLVAGGVPTVIGWTQPVRDDLATQAAADIYQRLCTGATTALALAFTRLRLHEADQQLAQPARRTHAWGTLHLLTRAGSDIRLERDQPALGGDEIEPNEVYKYLRGGRVRVLERGFVGRRRELQRLINVLVHGEDQADSAGVVLLGMKGVGKSCLAARAIQRASQEIDHPDKLGQIVLHGALNWGEVHKQFADLALRWGDRDAERILNDESEALPQRLSRLLHERWGKRRLVILLDDFEQNLDVQPEGPALLHETAATLLKELVTAGYRGKVRLIVTTTASFALEGDRQGWLSEIRLSAFAASSVRKLWIRDQSGAGGASRSGLPPIASLVCFPYNTWMALCERLGHNPRVLDWVRNLVAGQTPAEVAALVEQAGVALRWRPGAPPSGDEQNELARVFLRHMAYERAVSLVSADVRTFIRRVRVYEVAVPARAFEALCQDLEVHLDTHLPALQNLGLLEAGALNAEPAYRVSSLIEPELNVPDEARWYTAAAMFWEAESLRTERIEPAQRAWEHALSGQQQVIADRMGGQIASVLQQRRPTPREPEPGSAARGNFSLFCVWIRVERHRCRAARRSTRRLALLCARRIPDSRPRHRGNDSFPIPSSRRQHIAFLRPFPTCPFATGRGNPPGRESGHWRS